VLERHIGALDGNDPNGRREHEAYSDLVGRHRAAAAELLALATQMRSYRDLPMAEHDVDVMMAPNGQMAAFREFVDLERELVAFLAVHLEADEEMLASDRRLCTIRILAEECGSCRRWIHPPSWLLTDNFVVAPARAFAHHPARRGFERPTVSGDRRVVAPHRCRQAPRAAI
jgi:hypothetical protein